MRPRQQLVRQPHASGPDAVPSSPRSYAAKAKNAQEEHEAIRPTGKAFRMPKRTGLAGEEVVLYDLVIAARLRAR